jgi:hypothetical protein
MSRIDDLKRQNPNLNVNLIDLIAEADPSDSYKYLGFLIKMLKDNSSNNNMNILRHIFGEENILTLKKFHDHSNANRVRVKDIGLFNSFKQIKEEVSYADEVVRIKEMEKQTKILFKDEDWLVLIPLSYEASKLYGNGTKWCTTQERYWEQYLPDYMLIYIINRKDENKKFAISSKSNVDLVEGWKSNDDPISPFMIPIPTNILSIITEVIREKDAVEDLEEYKSINKRVTQHKQHKEYGEYDMDNFLQNYPSLPTYLSGTTIDNSSLGEYDFGLMEDDLRTYQDISDIDVNHNLRTYQDIRDMDFKHISQLFKKLKLM